MHKCSTMPHSTLFNGSLYSTRFKNGLSVSLTSLPSAVVVVVVVVTSTRPRSNRKSFPPSTVVSFAIGLASLPVSTFSSSAVSGAVSTQSWNFFVASFTQEDEEEEHWRERGPKMKGCCEETSGERQRS